MERIKSAVNLLATFQDPVSLHNICFRLRFDLSHLLSQFSQLFFWKQWFNIQSVRSFSKSYNIWSLMWFQVLSLIFQIRFEILSILLNFRLLPKCFHISWKWSEICFPLIPKPGSSLYLIPRNANSGARNKNAIKDGG